MRRQANLIGLLTVTRKELVRVMRIWPQTVLPPIITSVLYFVIFGRLIGSQVGAIHGFSYIQFIVPGLIMMSVVNNAYANVSSSFYGAKFQRNIDEMLIAPLPNAFILLGFIFGGILRGLIVGLLVLIVALFFTHIDISHIFLMIAVAIITAFLFACAGFLNGLIANKFDDVMD